MNTARFLLGLVLGIALMSAMPWATAESPAPDGTEPVAPGTIAPTAAPTPELGPQPAAAPAPAQKAATGGTRKAATGPELASGPTPERDPAPGSGPKPKPAPELDPGSKPKPDPDHGSGPKPKPDPEPGSGPTPAPNPDPGPPAPEPGSGPTPAPETGSSPKPEPKPAPKPSKRSPEPGTPTKHKPSPKPGNGQTPNPGAGPTPAPASPSSSDAPPAAGSNGDCFLTSAGLACRGNPPCVVTTSGVTCGTNCIVTSAGLTCPPRGGYVAPRGRVLSGGPVSREPNQAPTRPVRAEQEVESLTATGGQGANDSEGAGPLPFTGAPLVLWMALGCGLVAGGLLLRRLSSTAGAAIEPAGGLPPLGERPGPRRPRSGRAIVLPSLVLMACGALLRHRRRR